MTNKLQTYTYNRRDYTVDYRIKQFRHLDWNTGRITFVDFDGELGDRILAKMIKDGVADWSKLNV